MKEKAQARERLTARFDAVSEKEFKIIESYILEGYKQTLANLLLYLGKERSQAVLAKVAQAQGADFADAVADVLSQQEAAGKTNTDSSVMADAGQVLKHAGFFGRQTAEAVMNAMDGAEAQLLPEVSADYYTVNPLLSLNVDRYRFKFEDIIKLDDRSMQRMLQLADSREIARALKGADREVIDKFSRNFSQPAWAMLKEDMEFMGPVRISDVYAARHHIVKLVLQLAQQGQIVIVQDNIADWYVV